MNDYPTGLDGQENSGGTVKVLTDADGDGRFEKATVFADSLPFPPGCGRGAKARFHCRRAGHPVCRRHRWRRAPTPGRFCSPASCRATSSTASMDSVGLDGWIYAANGDSGGPTASIKTGKSLSISGHDGTLSLTYQER